MRVAKDISMRELARRANITQPTITGYEAGERYPDIRTLEVLAQALDVSPCWLAYGIDSGTGRARTVKTERVKALLEKALLELV
jgi:transcriptional regulator with XRE-family HTH domain